MIHTGGSIPGVRIHAGTVRAVLDRAVAELADHGFDESRLHAELLMEHLLGVPRLELLLHSGRALTREEQSAYRGLLDRRLAHEPLQYILGETEFMGLPISVDRSVHIPRPETELLAERAIAVLKADRDARTVLDIGTGSGNVAIAVAKYVAGIVVTSIDISGEALAIARRNAHRNGVTNIRFRKLNVFEEILRNKKFDMVVSNPPYVAALEYATLQPEVRGYEPVSATTDGGDGFSFIARICAFSRARLVPGGWLMMEIGWNQSDRARRLAEQQGLCSVEMLHDFAGIPRVMTARTRTPAGEP